MNVALLPGGTPDHVGLIPHFLDEADPRPAKEQFDERYSGGWTPQPNFKMNGFTLKYPGDPPMQALAMMALRDEVILVYESAFVVILQRDGSFEVCRMD